MSKTLYLPDHVAQKMNKEKQEAKSSDSLNSAYVDANERVLDPSLLDKPLLERLPQPTRYSGSRFKIDGGEVRIINDDEVIATILEPDDIKQV